MIEAILGWAISRAERGQLPDALVRFGIRRLCRQRLRDESERFRREGDAAVLAALDAGPVAPVPEKANEQHYELPPAFFERVLGPHRKYSSCWFPPGVTDLGAAEAASLEASCERAELADGQRILELGCGWGSLTLWMGEHYPSSSITAVSNSAPQREFIRGEARRRGLGNIEVVTADMNDFDPGARFDRVMSIEMFEHMRNYRELFRRVASWLEDDGLAFVHVFRHRTYSYFFEGDGEDDWMARYFFTAGVMPGEDLYGRFDADLRLERSWSWDGTHYQRTAEAWLQNLDREREAVHAIFRDTYGAEDAAMWIERWRIFFLACAELFGFRGGSEWGVTHFLFSPARVAESVGLSR